MGEEFLMNVAGKAMVLFWDASPLRSPCLLGEKINDKHVLCQVQNRDLTYAKMPFGNRNETKPVKANVRQIQSLR